MLYFASLLIGNNFITTSMKHSIDKYKKIKKWSRQITF